MEKIRLNMSGFIDGEGKMMSKPDVVAHIKELEQKNNVLAIELTASNAKLAIAVEALVYYVNDYEITAKQALEKIKEQQ